MIVFIICYLIWFDLIWFDLNFHFGRAERDSLKRGDRHNGRTRHIWPLTRWRGHAVRDAVTVSFDAVLSDIILSLENMNMNFFFTFFCFFYSRFPFFLFFTSFFLVGFLHVHIPHVAIATVTSHSAAFFNSFVTWGATQPFSGFWAMPPERNAVNDFKSICLIIDIDSSFTDERAGGEGFRRGGEGWRVWIDI